MYADWYKIIISPVPIDHIITNNPRDGLEAWQQPFRWIIGSQIIELYKKYVRRLIQNNYFSSADRPHYNK